LAVVLISLIELVLPHNISATQFIASPVYIDNLQGELLTTVFDPAQYGIPETLANYDVLAVENSENMLCWQENQIHITIRSDISAITSYISSSNSNAVRRELEALGIPDIVWGISVVGPGISREQVIGTKQRQNEMYQLRGCEGMRFSELEGRNRYTPYPTSTPGS